MIQIVNPTVKTVSFAALALPLLFILSGCVETVEGTTDMGVGRDTSAGTSTGRIAMATDGDYLFTLNRSGAVCTARFDGAISSGSTDLTDLVCTDGGRGTATVVYDSAGKPDRVVYAVNGKGGGTIKF